MKNELYTKHTMIIDTIYKLKSPSAKKRSLSKKCGEIISQIVTDALAISLDADLHKENENEQLIDSLFQMMEIQQWNFCDFDVFYFRYDFWFDIVRKIGELMLCNENAAAYFDHFITHLIDEYFVDVAKTSKHRNFVNDLRESQILSVFGEMHQCKLLRAMCEHFEIIKCDGLEVLIKELVKNTINSDDNCADLIAVWFPILMRNQKDWIVEELPKQMPLCYVRKLIKGIFDYIVSKECKQNGDGSEAMYYEFINKYTNTKLVKGGNCLS